MSRTSQEFQERQVNVKNILKLNTISEHLSISYNYANIYQKAKS